MISCYRGAHRRLIGVVVIGSSTEEYLFHFAEMQCILVVSPELHEAHVARLGQLRYALYAREESVAGKIKLFISGVSRRRGSKTRRLFGLTPCRII